MEGVLVIRLRSLARHGFNAASANSHAGNFLQVYVLAAECFVVGVASVSRLLCAFRAHVTHTWHRREVIKL